MVGKYILVGLANTLLTASIIFILMYFDVELFLANALGYILGIVLSYILNSFFTFKVEASLYRFLKFIICCLICYVVNVVVINLFLITFPNSQYISQLFGMGAYTVTGFIINNIWVMK